MLPLVESVNRELDSVSQSQSKDSQAGKTKHFESKLQSTLRPQKSKMDSSAIATHALEAKAAAMISRFADN